MLVAKNFYRAVIKINVLYNATARKVEVGECIKFITI